MTLSAQDTGAASSARRVPQSDTATVNELWFTRCPVPTTFGIALQLGWLQEEFPPELGVSFRALQESKDPRVLQSHYTHTQKNSFRHGGNYPALYAQATGANTRVIGLSFVHASQTILTLPESPIRSVKDLKGRRLLVNRRPHEAIDHAYLSALRTYETALATAGLTLADVEIVEHIIHSSYIHDRLVQKPSADAPEPPVQKSSTGSWPHTLYPLVRGEVDAIASGGTASLQFQTSGELRVVFDLATLPVELQANNNFPLVFAVNEELLLSRPDLVERVLKRALQAERLARENPDEALHRLAVELAQPERLIRQVYGPALSELLYLDFDPRKVAALKAQAQFLLDRGAIPRPVDVENWLAPEPLERVRRLTA
jgi:ABC-type nitrate/sulfonate/bicarbonate transport system substrate-binding protein